VVTEPIQAIEQIGPEGTLNSVRLIEQIAPHYAQAGGVENALRLARAALKDTSDAEYRTYFPVFDPRGYKASQTLIPVERMDKKLSGEFLPDGYTSKIIRNRQIIDHVADGDQLLIADHLSGREVPEAVGHEGTHGAILRSLLTDEALEDARNKRGYFYNQPVTRTHVGRNPVFAKTPIPGQVVVAVPRSDGDFEPVVVDTKDFQYTTQPIELDPRLAQIRRLSAQMRGKDIKTPEDANELINRVVEDKDYALASGISDAESDYIGMLSPKWQRFMARRMIEVPAVGAAALAASQANAAEPTPQPNPVDEYTRDQLPTGRVVGNAPTMTGATASETQRVFGRKDGNTVRYEAAMEDVLFRRMVPWVKSLPQYPGMDNVASAVEALHGRPSTPEGQGLANQFLNHMKSVSYGGDSAPDASVSQSEYGRWQREGGGDVRSLWGEGAIGRVTPGGQQMFENQRDYDLLRTFQQGSHSPGSEGLFPVVLAGIGEMFDPSGDTTKLYKSRLKTLMGGGPGGKIEEAMYWWDQSNPTRDAIEGSPARYKGGIQGSRYPGLSPLTSDGFNQTVSNSDNPVGAWFTAGELAARGPFATAFTRPGELIRSAKQAYDQATVNQWSGRPTPIMPDADPVLGYDAMVSNDQARQFQQKAASARAPKVMQALGMRPRYLSQAEEMAVHMPGDILADLGTGVGVVGRASKLAAKSATTAGKLTALPRSAAWYATSGLKEELPSEAVLGGVLSYAQQPADRTAGAFDPEPYNPNVTLGGEAIAADDPRYGEAWRSGQKEQQRRLSRVRDAARMYRGSK
jgi:hypothetical protein